MSRKAVQLVSNQIIKLILVLVVIFLVFRIFLLPSYSGAQSIFKIFDFANPVCKLPKPSCADCLNIVSVSPSSVEFKSSDDWKKSECIVQSDSISLTFGESIRQKSPPIMEFAESCLKDPQKKSDWQVQTPLIAAGSVAAISKNTLALSGLKKGCHYRISISDNLVSDGSDRVLADNLRVFAFQRGVK
jgi:hypothetical protein